MIEGYAIRQLHQLSGLSAPTLRRIVQTWLTKDPPPPSRALSQYRNLIFDGTFLHNRMGVVALMDAPHHRIVQGRYGIAENSISQLRSFFMLLKEQGLTPFSCTVDGNPQVIRLLTTLWPTILIQRCLVHIQRQGLMWCRRHPSRPDAKHLRKIFLHIPAIRSHEQRDIFLNTIAQWERRYGGRLAHCPERGWVLSDLIRARSMLLKALPYMFYYLDHPTIPSTTNGLEGYFARLKQHYRQHRGLAASKRDAYFQWYFYLRPR